tara:strand:- start:194 stop:1612 length:1419 start_codon:yes stop_codon:yes gene_type:complete
MKKIQNNLLDQLKKLSGPKGWISEKDKKIPYLTDQRGQYESKTPLILLPKSTNTVSNILKFCQEHQIPVVPQGGNTGLVGGSICGIEKEEILINLEKMNKVRHISLPDSTLIVESGLKLLEVQKVANSNKRIFPLSLASEGSCQIGGNLATNAGGINVVKYGNVRDLVLGLEVVLPDGSIWNGLKSIKKDNTGYDLKNLFLGSEGTLGIITAAALKLFIPSHKSITCLVSVPKIETAINILNSLQDECADTISSFEFFSDFALNLVLKNIFTTKHPMKKNYEWYILIEAGSSIKDLPVKEILENTFSKILSEHPIGDAIIANSENQRNSLWKLRESIPEAQKIEGISFKHDISIPLSHLSHFLDETRKALHQLMPNCRPCIFGHLGDGNVHYNIHPPQDLPIEKFKYFSHKINSLVYDATYKYGGSISGEHGIGFSKKENMLKYKSEIEISLIKKIKKALDPKEILNPGKII